MTVQASDGWRSRLDEALHAFKSLFYLLLVDDGEEPVAAEGTSTAPARANASISLSTSASVRCSRVRRSEFGGLVGETVRKTVEGA